MLTVEQALKRLCSFNGASGSSWDAASNLTRLNEVVEMIFERGDFEGTLEYGCVACSDGCFYLPYFLETARSGWVGKRPLPVFNSHYMTFDDVTRAREYSTRTKGHFQATGIRRPITKNPSFSKYVISINAENQGDDGVSLRFKGVENGIRKDFRVIVSGDGYSDSDLVITDLIDATKPITEGSIYVYAKNLADGSRELLAHYPEQMENPSFAQYRLFGSCSSCCSMVLRSKKRFFKLEDNDELVPINSSQALKFGYQALNAQDRDDPEGYIVSINLMENHLSEADENLQESEPSVSANLAYETALDPAND